MRRIITNLALLLIFFVLLPVNAKAAAKLSITDITYSNGNTHIYVSTTATIKDNYCMDITVYKVNSKQKAVELGETGSYLAEKITDLTWDKLKPGTYGFAIRLFYGNGIYYPIARTTIYKDITYIDGKLIATDSDYDPSVANFQASKKDRKAINKLFNNYFKSVKRYDISAMNKCFKTNPGNIYITDKKIQKFLKKAHSKCLKYEITHIKVSGNNATATVLVNYYDATNVVYKALRSSVKNYVKTKKMNMSTQELLKRLNKDYKKKYKNIYETSIKVKLVKSNGEWKIKKCNYDLRDINDCSISNTIDYYSEHPLDLIF